MKKFLLTILLFPLIPAFAQADEFIFGSVTVKLEKSNLTVTDSLDEIIFRKSFQHPAIWLNDLDEDGSDEVLVADSSIENSLPRYYLYIYSVNDNYILIDSINSSVILPFEAEFKELTGIALVTGDSRFNIYNQPDKEFYLPINCWLFDGTKMILVNDSLYDIFIEENEIILEMITEFFSLNDKNCNSSEAVLSLIISAYVNFINAGEFTSASQFIKEFYYCENADELINNIKKIMEN